VKFLDSAANLFGADHRIGQGTFGKDEGEFFSTITTGHVFSAQATVESIADDRESLVSGGMPKVVVVAFEVIEIEHHNRDGTIFSAGRVQFTVQEFLHVAAVVEVGEGIADGFAQLLKAAQAEP